MTIDWFAFAPLFLKAAGITLWLSWLALLLGAVGGTLVALARTSRLLPLRLLALLYTEFFRSIPILIVMFFAYFGAPLVLGLDISAFLAATIALALHASSTMSEVVRAGLESVGRGQWEAAQAAGMRYGQVMRYVVGPQALRVILPPSVGIYITTLKESSLASIIGYIELTKTGLLVRESTGGGFTALLLLAVIYFVMNYLISLGGAALERRFNVGRDRNAPDRLTLVTAGAGQ
jgi:His/Glu/Gln/Arg/opine family amino acid ABC transporter permease subunit